MIPLKDNVPTKLFPAITRLFILLNCLMYLYQVYLGPLSNKKFIYILGTIPYYLINHYFAHPVLTTYRIFPYPITMITSICSCMADCSIF